MTTIRSNRCPWCDIPWPLDARFEVCPQCREETRHSPRQAIDGDEAESDAAHASFGWWLWDNELL